MKRLVCAAIACALLAPAVHAAPVTGRISFLTKRGQKPVVTETLVWLEPTGRTARRTGAAFTMTTRSKTFLPHVLAVPAGSTISFPNEDPISHNLFSLTPGYTFDLGLYRRGPGKTQKFETPGIVNVYCNIHPNMSAVVHVMNTPWYGFADARGGFSFDVPAGKYRLVAWNELGGSVTSDLDVRADGRIEGETVLTIDSRNFRFVQHMNKNGQAYRPTREY
jgi:plastocyanin